jgi:hypothetical protein
MECLLLTCTTAANGSEREQISPLLDSVRLKTLKPGRPKALCKNNLNNLPKS